MRIGLLAVVLVVNGLCYAVDTHTGTFDSSLRTLQAFANGQPLTYPVIGLNDGSRVDVSFDVLADERDYLRYELIHCDADWQPSCLVDSEYLEGFNQGDIEDYEYSRLTATRYVHYSFCVPNDRIAPRISGNYLIRIYHEEDPERTLAIQRLMVSEQSASVRASVSSRTDMDCNKGQQQLSVKVDASRAEVPDLFNDLVVKVSQNGRIDNVASVSKPLRIESGQVAVYEHLAPLIFEAGNEYRRMEPVSVRVPGMGVASIFYHEPYYNIMLRTDKPRAEDMYIFDQTQHGKYIIREYDSEHSDTEADYVMVHFSLDMPYVNDSDIYLDGDFAYRRLDECTRMEYNNESGMYERTILLKQGAYNYQYLSMPRGDSRGHASMVEGDKYQTVNEYLIAVYARHPGDRYDRLVAVKIVKSE